MTIHVDGCKNRIVNGAVTAVCDGVAIGKLTGSLKGNCGKFSKGMKKLEADAGWKSTRCGTAASGWRWRRGGIKSYLSCVSPRMDSMPGADVCNITSFNCHDWAENFIDLIKWQPSAIPSEGLSRREWQEVPASRVCHRILRRGGRRDHQWIKQVRLCKGEQGSEETLVR